jgi:ribose 5-phosphate isomerase B
MKNLSIALGADHAGFELKEEIRKKLEEWGIEHYDFGAYDRTPVDYPLIARGVASKVADGDFMRGIIICGSGIGVAIAANKIRGIRATNSNEIYSAKMSRAHNNSNILTMGSRIIGSDVAVEIVKIWLETKFEGGRHQKRIEMIE